MWQTAAARRLRIGLLTVSFDSVGPARALAAIATRINRARFEPSVCCIAGPASGPIPEQLTAADVSVRVLGCQHWSDLRGVARVCRWVREARLDVLHTRLPRADVYGRIAAWQAGIPVVCNVVAPQRAHFDDVHGILVGPVLRRVSRRLLRSASRIVVNSAGGVRGLEQAGIPVDAIAVIPNGVDCDLFERSHPVRERTRSQLGIAKDAPVVGIVARLVRLKQIEDLLAAVPQTICAHPRVRVLVVGGGPLWQELHDQAVAVGVDDRLIWAGERTDIPELLAAMDVFIFTSRREGMPNAVLEAMAAGLPVVAVDASGTSELVSDGVTGFLVESGDVDALASRVCTLLSDAGRRAAMGAAGHARAGREFSMANMIAAFEQLYESVAPEDVHG